MVIPSIIRSSLLHLKSLLFYMTVNHNDLTRKCTHRHCIFRWKPANCESRVHGYICQINQHTLGKSFFSISRPNYSHQYYSCWFFGERVQTRLWIISLVNSNKELLLLSVHYWFIGQSTKSFSVDLHCILARLRFYVNAMKENCTHCICKEQPIQYAFCQSTHVFTNCLLAATVPDTPE
jgi:hypothetical protein